MLTDQMAAVLALLGAGGGGRPGTNPVPAAAQAAAACLGVDEICAAVAIATGGTVHTWGGKKTSAALEDAQFTLGEGPSVAALSSGSAVLVPDLSDAVERWPGFAPAALDLGVGAVFAVPLQVGAISVGVLLAHRGAPGPLSLGQLADALALADAVTVLVLHCAPLTRDPADAGRTRPQPGWEQPPAYRAEVHQATGVLSVQLNVPLSEALLLLRAHAYSTGRPISEVAADVVAHRIHVKD
ncbi:MAG TPA: GAF and ANTAR domain-containing protein [Actinocrinis sp.]|nr:GAF and ANTAR domain-containing protein [Actinocrinis sp.]